ncbi:hypothetical protein FOMPIDRAFT_93618 [Fomitopsis schrenkii]|uniref:Uncharacterized protein n=1 Tax=Fomitopsis schrenkii TaxID=2126942 RepID=S8EWP3_FOMSC|nr:hypothetical protein FOMPIDRAFT_93618 [Fomitopsis schrenkii]
MAAVRRRRTLLSVTPTTCPTPRSLMRRIRMRQERPKLTTGPNWQPTCGNDGRSSPPHARISDAGDVPHALQPHEEDTSAPGNCDEPPAIHPPPHVPKGSNDSSSPPRAPTRNIKEVPPNPRLSEASSYQAGAQELSRDLKRPQPHAFPPVEHPVRHTDPPATPYMPTGAPIRGSLRHTSRRDTEGDHSNADSDHSVTARKGSELPSDSRYNHSHSGHPPGDHSKTELWSPPPLLGWTRLSHRAPLLPPHSRRDRKRYAVRQAQLPSSAPSQGPVVLDIFKRVPSSPLVDPSPRWDWTWPISDDTGGISASPPHAGDEEIAPDAHLDNRVIVPDVHLDDEHVVPDMHMDNKVSEPDIRLGDAEATITDTHMGYSEVRRDVWEPPPSMSNPGRLARGIGIGHSTPHVASPVEAQQGAYMDAVEGEHSDSPPLKLSKNISTAPSWLDWPISRNTHTGPAPHDYDRWTGWPETLPPITHPPPEVPIGEPDVPMSEYEEKLSEMSVDEEAKDQGIRASFWPTSSVLSKRKTRMERASSRKRGARVMRRSTTRRLERFAGIHEQPPLKRRRTISEDGDAGVSSETHLPTIRDAKHGQRSFFGASLVTLKAHPPIDDADDSSMLVDRPSVPSISFRSFPFPSGIVYSVYQKHFLILGLPLGTQTGNSKRVVKERRPRWRGFPGTNSGRPMLHTIEEAEGEEEAVEKVEAVEEEKAEEEEEAEEEEKAEEEEEADARQSLVDVNAPGTYRLGSPETLWSGFSLLARSQGSQTLPEDVDVSSGRQQMPSRPFMPFAPGPSGDNTENEIEGVGDTPKPQRTAPVVGRRRFRPFVPPLSPNRPRPNRRTRISGAYAHRASTGSSDERGSAGLLDKDEMLNRQTEVNPALRRTRHTLRQVGTDDDDNHTGGLMNGERELDKLVNEWANTSDDAVVTIKDMQRILLVGLEMWRQQRQRGGSSSMPTQANAPVSLHGRTERQRPYRGQPRHRDLKTLQLQVSPKLKPSGATEAPALL